MKKSLLIIICLTVVIVAQRTGDDLTISADFVESRSFDANNITLRKVTNRGDFNTATWSVLNYGTLNARRILFDSGIWLTGKISGSTHAAIKYYSANYSPGPILDGQPAMDSYPNDSLRYRVYKIFKDNNQQNPDYTEWPVDFGAPVDNEGNPKLYSDQLLWTVYNTYDIKSVDSNYVTEKEFGILPVEVQQKVYGRKGTEEDFNDIFHNVVFVEWTIINKGNTSIDSAFIGLWSDIDFYDISSNIPAIDISRQTGYLWSGTEFAPSLGGVPPAVGVTLLYGPSVPSPGSVSIFKGKEKTDFENLQLNSFHAIADDITVDPLIGVPRSEKQVYNAASGFSNAGSIIIDTSTGRPTKFPFNGNPVDSTGWLFSEEKVGNGSGFVLFTGPFNLAVSDTQWVMAAFVPGLGVDNKESIIKMRDKIDILRSMPYDSLAFGKDPRVITGVQDNYDQLPNNIVLHQNYPNPFNPVTSIRFEVPGNVKGNVKLSVYNILGEEIKVLANREFNPGIYSVDFNANDFSSGVYFYRLQTQNSVITKKMILLK